MNKETGVGEVKPREFKLTVYNRGDNLFRLYFNFFVEPNYFMNEEQLHVIEKSAYDKLKAENEKAKELIGKLRNDMVNIHNLLLDYYSDEIEYPHHASYAFHAAKKSLEELKQWEAGK